MSVRSALFGLIVLSISQGADAQEKLAGTGFSRGALVTSGFIYESAPFPSCHASTLAQLPEGDLIAAWFGGSDEGEKDVSIWSSRQSNGKWSAPVEVAAGTNGGPRYPCWNPVLFQPSTGPLLLFYKVGPSPSKWWGMRTTSTDGGKSWSAPKRLPEGILGPIKNKPIQLEDGTLLCPSSSEDEGWRIHVESSADLGVSWKRTQALSSAAQFGAIQPTILNWSGRPMQMLCRSRQKKITSIQSIDQGKSWGEMSLTSLPNPNAGLDAVLLQDNRALLVYNHTSSGRSPLNVAVSTDGENWQAALVLEGAAGEYSYPAVIQTRDGLVHAMYTWKRQRIKHAVMDPSKFVLQPISEGKWPK